LRTYDLITIDNFFNRELKVKQERNGYRYSIDAVLLANYVKPKAKDRIVDIGTGCGIIPLILAFRNDNIKHSEMII